MRNPLWSLEIFALDVIIIHQLAAHRTEGRRAATQTERT
jgi:hypothetical protein